ncbi:unnamed protein product [Symbiodinium pilosum]|uniref:Protein C10 n=1 Tax=Symbiodinium pilosum TaxID=2952 RepID=A0A812WKA7_SYMPI|nr:unnamed protein product [Symbiodinium pilosum]
MGTACSNFVQDKVEDAEPCSVKSAGVGMESEPLWKQMAEAQNEMRKAAEAARPEVDKLLAERAAARKAAAKQAEAERQAKDARLRELEKQQREEEEKAISKKEEAKKAQTASGKAKPKAKAQGDAKSAAAPAPGPSAKLTKDQAKDALNRALAIFETPENKRKLQEAVNSCRGDDAKKMAVLMPLVQGMLKDLLESHGFSADKILHAVMQIATHAQGDKKMSKQLAKLQAALEGNI